MAKINKITLVGILSILLIGGVLLIPQHPQKQIDQKNVSPAQEKSTPQKKVISEQKKYEDTNTHITFTYPIRWGDPTTSEFRTPQLVALVPNLGVTVSNKILFPGPACKTMSCTITIGVTPYSEINRYQKTCIEAFCEDKDMIREKKEGEEQSNILIAGFKGVQTDIYSTQFAERFFTVFTDTQKITIAAYINSNTPLENLNKDIRVKDGLTHLIATHSNLKELKIFYDEVDAMIRSLQLIK